MVAFYSGLFYFCLYRHITVGPHHQWLGSFGTPHHQWLGQVAAHRLKDCSVLWLLSYAVFQMVPSPPSPYPRPLSLPIVFSPDGIAGLNDHPAKSLPVYTYCVHLMPLRVQQRPRRRLNRHQYPPKILGKHQDCCSFLAAAFLGWPSCSLWYRRQFRTPF